MTTLRPFHLAIPVTDLQKSKVFYTHILGCSLGRVSEKWIDLNFFNHQLVLHETNNKYNYISNCVDEKDVPVPHFGVILNYNEWNIFAKKIKKQIKFIIEPYIRFKGKPGEHATMFFLDPDKNALEFKAFKNDNMIFMTDNS